MEGGVGGEGQDNLVKKSQKLRIIKKNQTYWITFGVYVENNIVRPTSDLTTKKDVDSIMAIKPLFELILFLFASNLPMQSLLCRQTKNNNNRVVMQYDSYTFLCEETNYQN